MHDAHRPAARLPALLLTLALALTLSGPARAEPAVSEGPPSTANPPFYSKPVAVGIVGGIWGVVYTWTYFAWYRHRATTGDLVYNSEGLFGGDTYAGGSDKLGHMWGNYIMNRWTSNLMEAGGWSPLVSAVVSTTATTGFFTMIEIKDGYHQGFGFSWYDVAFNLAGNALAVGTILSPKLDDMFDFKVYYLPTRKYLRSLVRHGVVDAGEDYSGQTYVLAYHLDSIDAVRQDPELQVLRYLDLTLGFRSANYLPKPEGHDTHRYQELSLGVAFNFQHLIDALYGRDTPPRGHGQGSLRFINEGFGVPYTNRPLFSYRKNNGPAPEEPEEAEVP